MSGPGHIVSEHNTEGIWGRLSNFDTGSAVLKLEHTTFLEANVVPILRAGGSLRLIGLASRLGNSDHNKMLSRYRLDGAIAFLRAAAPGGFLVARDEPDGEQAARWAGVADDHDNNEAWRSIIFSAWRRHDPPPPPPPPVRVIPPHPAGSRHFRLRTIFAASFGLPGLVGAEGLAFDILDVDRQMLCGYDCRGISIGHGTPVSLGFGGDWNDFTTARPMDVGNFGGVARFLGISSGPNSASGFELSPLVCPAITFLPFNSGFQLGASIGAGVGVVTRSFQPYPVSAAWWPHRG